MIFLDFFLLCQQGQWDVFVKMYFFGVNSTKLAKFLKKNYMIYITTCFFF